MSVNILCLCGSIVSTCYVKRLTRIVAAGAAEAGANTVGFIECDQLDIPTFTYDREMANGLPSQIVRIKEQLEQADGLIVGAPEFNAGITSSLKNVIDWASRPRSGTARAGERSFEGPRNESFTDLRAVLVSGSKFEHAGKRGLECLRTTLESVGVAVLTPTVSVANCSEAKFSGDATLLDTDVQHQLMALGGALVTDLSQ